jgi:hypothetical protein
MCWVALDRGIRLAAARGLPGPVQRWTTERDRIYAQVHDQGWNDGRRAFVQHYHTDVLDASLLRMPNVRFVAPKDPMWTATLEAMDAELVTDSLVYRYDPAASPDGLRGSEGTFSLCTFAYVDALARAGRVEESRRAFEKMLTYADHVGLFSEEIALNGEQIGNFPQAFTHLALIDAAITLDAGWPAITGLVRFRRSAQHDDRARARRNPVTRMPLAAGRDGRRLERVDLRHPLLTRPDRRKHELQRLPPGVDEHEEVVVEQRAAVGGVLGRVLTFQVDGDAAGTRVAPLLGGDDRACGGEAPQQAAVDAGQEPPAPEHRMRQPERDERAGEREQVLVDVAPVEPGQLAVLAVGVVVAPLGAPQLVTAEQHRGAGRQQQRGEHRAGRRQPP